MKVSLGGVGGKEGGGGRLYAFLTTLMPAAQ
jgi:hypothetical protein